MRRQRSLSFFAESEDEYIEEYNKMKSISERRRCRTRSYCHNNDDNTSLQNNNNSYSKKKYFQSYDDLELDQLGVNSTFQFTSMEKEESEDNERGLIQKINNINISFKQNNNISFFTNLAPFTKNIIGSLHPIIEKDNLINNKVKKEDCTAKNLLNDFKKNSDDMNLEHKDKKEENEDSENSFGYDSYQMGYSGINDKEEDSKIIKRERYNSIIENNEIDEKNEYISFLDNININELSNSTDKIVNNNSNSNENTENYNDLHNEDNLQIEPESNNKNELDNNVPIIDMINNIENNRRKKEKENNAESSNNNPNKDKKLRRYTFDINAFFPDTHKEGEETDNKAQNQNKTLQNFISNNEFLSKNIDYVDEHLKFLITGSDLKTKYLFLNHLLNTKINYEDNNYESFNICKKVIKLLGDYIKLELYEENCSLCYSHMLETYIDFSDGVIFIININIPSSAKYIYDIIDKLKYKLNKDKRHFNSILLCFEIIHANDFENINIPKEQQSTTPNNNNDNNKKQSIDIINKIINDYEIKPNYLTFVMNDKGFHLKNEKFEHVINKFLSIAYLKKERKRRVSQKEIKKHKRGITGI